MKPKMNHAKLKGGLQSLFTACVHDGCRRLAERKPNSLALNVWRGKVWAALEPRDTQLSIGPLEKDQSRLAPGFSEHFFQGLEMVIRDHHVSLIAYVYDEDFFLPSVCEHVMEHAPSCSIHFPVHLTKPLIKEPFWDHVTCEQAWFNHWNNILVQILL